MRTITATSIATLFTMAGVLSISPACGGDKSDTDTIQETGVDTESTSDTSETGSETGDSGYLAPPLFSVAIYPQSMRVDISASWQLRVVVTELESEGVVDSPAISYTSSDAPLRNHLGECVCLGTKPCLGIPTYTGRPTVNLTD